MGAVPITSDLAGYQLFWLKVLGAVFIVYCSFWLLMLYLFLKYTR